MFLRFVYFTDNKSCNKAQYTAFTFSFLFGRIYTDFGCKINDGNISTPMN